LSKFGGDFADSSYLIDLKNRIPQTKLWMFHTLTYNSRSQVSGGSERHIRTKEII